MWPISNLDVAYIQMWPISKCAATTPHHKELGNASESPMRCCYDQNATQIWSKCDQIGYQMRNESPQIEQNATCKPWVWLPWTTMLHIWSFLNNQSKPIGKFFLAYSRKQISSQNMRHQSKCSSMGTWQWCSSHKDLRILRCLWANFSRFPVGILQPRNARFSMLLALVCRILMMFGRSKIICTVSSLVQWDWWLKDPHMWVDAETVELLIKMICITCSGLPKIVFRGRCLFGWTPA